MNKRRLLVLIAMLLYVCGMLAACENKPEPQKQTEESVMSGLYPENPAQDDALNILMIGNSFCYYYAEELYGMLTAAGYENVNICNVYYPGCRVLSHWQWWKNNEANYEFYTTNKDGRNKEDGTSLEYCLNQRNWDLISLQEASSAIRTSGSVQQHLDSTKQQLTELWAYIQTQFPQSRHAWHQIWAYQTGYDRNGYQVNDLQVQAADTLEQKEFALAICEEYSLERFCSGEAWQIVREGGYDNLCARIGINNGLGDYYHDGDIGGGQFLNACVWFETITGQSCIGNTYRPDYPLDETLIGILQAAAHQAVTADK